MASQKQIDANRLNAQKSTGPRSLKGKAISRLNAIRDNLTGQITTLTNEDRPVFEQQRARLIAGYDPKTPAEEELAQAIAWDTWRLNHLRAVEMNVYAIGLCEMDEEEDGDPESGQTAASSGSANYLDTAFADACTFRLEAKRFDLMSLYEQRMNRTLHRNIALLRELQAERKRNYEQDKKEEVIIARLHEFNEMPISVPATPSRNGFLFSNEEIAVAAVRQRYVDTATSLLKNTPHINLHGALRNGCGDSLLRRIREARPLSAEECTRANTAPPEVLALRRVSHPEEFYLGDEHTGEDYTGLE